MSKLLKHLLNRLRRSIYIFPNAVSKLENVHINIVKVVMSLHQLNRAEKISSFLEPLNFQ